MIRSPYSLLRRGLLLFIIIIVLLSGLQVKASRTIEVEKKSYFAKISDAIKNANDGDTIIVHEGTYEENIVINKRISLIADGKVTLVGVGTKPVVTIAANKVKIVGFNITTNGFFSTAIYIANGCGLSQIYNNILMNAYFGIYSDKTFGNDIINNSITRNDFGIMLNYTSESEFKQNKIENNKYGIALSGSRKNIIQENNITNNQYGIYLFDSQNDTIFNNYLFSNFYGIYLTAFSSNETVKNNFIINSQFGIFIDTSHFNNVLKNRIESSLYGIDLQNCRYNNVSTNFIRNETVGIQLYATMNNSIFNNTVTESTIGIEIDNAYNDTIKENNFLNISAHAITTYKTTRVEIIKNVISSAKNGIVFDSSSSNLIVGNELSNVHVGVYIYNSELNIIKNMTIKEISEWYIKSQSGQYNYVENLMFNSEKLNFSFSGKVAIKSATVSIVPKGYTYLNVCIFVNTNQGSSIYINFSFNKKPNEKVTVLYTTDGKNWEKTSTMNLFENLNIVRVKIENNGTYALFSYNEEVTEGIPLIVMLFLLLFILIVTTFFFIRKSKNEK
ncbi:MAG: NosD domain-containing protein [Thermoproteota archaeon]|nr:right-handed parallel beta-helix repeat-containing protein [Candidatus Brockarchaeota archaeon]